ncbi:pectinesterase family protein [Luteimonas sp. 3794]|uniref:pectinesterase family protein n=1 Tax=Luteimonas sp. 3794 TaxID=2817730 RepID=UPI0028656A2C|nr:pectinesterase family protein [Luteimonas sp. 3794]MDR6991900.1 pectinesterase [Luteimonas sp. 3794]
MRDFDVVAGGPFADVQAAVDAAVAAGRPARIRIAPGVWRGVVDVPPGAPPLTLTGGGKGVTTLVNGHAASKIDPQTGRPFGVYGSATLFVRSDDFRAERLHIVNDAGPFGPAVALVVDGTRAAFRQVRVLGHQNTLYLRKPGAVAWFRDSRVEGTEDYIFGAATALFEGGSLHSHTKGAVTAASTPAGQAYGFVFERVRLSVGAGVSSVYLGRAGAPHAAVLFADCVLDAPVSYPGWYDEGSEDIHATARFGLLDPRGGFFTVLPAAPWAGEAPALPTREMLFGDWRPFE